MSEFRRRGTSVEVVDAKFAVDLATAQTYSENVFLFVPNLIGVLACEITWQNHWHCSTGYTRILLAALSLHFMSFHPRYSTIAYCVSCLLDAFDGHAARALGQTSKFGAVLDMVTDRYTDIHVLVFYHSLMRVLGVLHHACFVTYLPYTLTGLCFSNSLSHSTLPVITCTCTGESALHRFCTGTNASKAPLQQDRAATS